MIRQAVTCDRAGCLAVLVDPFDDLYALDVPDFQDVIRGAGWTRDADGHSCPACAEGRGSVLERGECPRCLGRTVDKSDGAHCLYCRVVTAHPADDW